MEAVSGPADVAFGRFRVLPHRRELLVDGQPLKLGGRAYDVLMALIEARGTVVSKDELMTRVWPDRVVEENALQVQISALRAAFGPERWLVRTVSGRGYQFAGEIRILPPSADDGAGVGEATAEPRSVLPATNLPAPVSELIGREEEMQKILSLAASHRLVSLVGPGGIGKTRLALAAARRVLAKFADGVWLAELAPLSDPALVPATVLGAVGLGLAVGEISAPRAAQALGGRRLLVVLDTCEHVVDAVAELAEAVLRACVGVCIVATSREPLRVEGEQLYAVPPLGVPAGEGDDPWQYGAVRLFAIRSREIGAHLPDDRRVASALATICRRLDGIPLAIELAAARASALGVEGLAAHLDDRFNLLTGGRRSALRRHQTLRATLDWSFELLSEPERVILRRLAIFAAAFSLEAAGAVAASAEITPPEVLDDLANLVAKSLVATEIEGTLARYRLLDTTRAYAFEKLAESGEHGRIARRHAEYYRDLFNRAEGEFEQWPTAEWLAAHGRRIDNLRAALDWAFSPEGDAAIGVALTAAAVPLWMHLSLLEECRGRAERALAALPTGADRDEHHEMKLRVALGTSLTDTLGAAAPEIGGAWTRALELADKLDDAEYQFRSLRGLWSFNLYSGRNRVALLLAQRFCTLAAKQPGPNDRLVGERMIGVTQFYLGNLKSARHHLERVLADDAAPDHRSSITRFHLDIRVATRAFLAWILWLQGLPDQAIHAAESTFEDARATNHVNSLCYALARAACPISLLVGEMAAAEHYVRLLVDHSTRHGLAHWRAIGHCHQGALAIKRSDIATGLRLLCAGLEELGEFRFAVLRLIAFLMAEALTCAGQIVEGLAAVEEALELTERSEESWAIAELLRIKGELLLSEGPQGATPAEGLFQQALDWARRQGALSLELRAATSLGRLLRDQDRPADAAALLQPVYNRFTEGFGTADLKTARALLDAVCEPPRPDGHKAAAAPCTGLTP